MSIIGILIYMQSFLQEFKTFAMRGNVIDLAVAVVIGGAFGKIVSSLVDSIILPFIGLFTGGIDFSERMLTFGDVSFAYGAFVQSVIDFIIIALVIFVAIKAINKLKPASDSPAPKGPSEEVLLLREIRDNVKK